jgi:DNA-binding response OmpR family regulator
MAKVLIVEDDKAIADVVRLMLTEDGFACRVSFDGEEGVRQCGVFRPDVILLDILLPKMSGINVSQELYRAGNGLERIPIVIYSAGRQSLADLAVQAGTPYYIAKPFDFKELLALIKLALKEQTRTKPRFAPGH